MQTLNIGYRLLEKLALGQGPGLLLLAALASACASKDGNEQGSAGSGTSASGSPARGGSTAGSSGSPATAGSETGGSGGTSSQQQDGGAGGAGGAEEQAVCGDGIVNGNEACDGEAPEHQSCEGLGFGPGPLRCKANCQADVSACAPGENCGNGQIDGAEQCDDGDANSDTEPNACRKNCSLPSCGDSVVDRGEGCDDGRANSDFRADTCRSNCQPAHCGDGLIDSGEECDSKQLGRATCEREGFSSGKLSCTDHCELDTSQCFTCGDGVADGDKPADPGYEACDTDDFRNADCKSFGFVGGALRCNQCKVDTSHCGTEPDVCGDDVVAASETCDGVDLHGKTCADFGFTGGRLTCKSDCSGFITTRCNTCGNGMIEAGEVCDDGNTKDDFTCSADCRQACGIGYGECTGNTSKYCGFDLSGKAVVQTEQCDALKGLSCKSGLCQGTCAVSALGSSYLGCDYYPTITNNALLSQSVGDFAVTVANSGTKTANVTVTQGATTVTTTTVAAGDVAVIVLPWTSLATARTVLVPDGAYRVRTDQPVTVYQYNPLNYQKSGSGYTYTNDASLLLPTNTWTGNYMVVGRNDWQGYPGLYAVVAKEDNTTVTLLPSATGKSIYAGAGVAADGTGTVTLNEGDVLHVTSSGDTAQPSLVDVTGTRIQADKPVEVIGGHECTDVPYNITACDHLEEAMLPIETLGSDYLVSPPLSAGTPRVRMVRIIATEPNTTITYNPPQAGAPTTLAAVGSYVEINQTTAAFEITADHRIMVAEYLVGQTLDSKPGDPAMVLAVPVQQYRTHYLFHAPTNYESSYVNITAPTGTTVTLDSMTLAAGTAIGGTGYSVISVELDKTGTGNHVIDASDRVGITVYGYGQYTSYWYPGGLELTQF
jgi:cysteine-rich repeat protein